MGRGCSIGTDCVSAQADLTCDGALTQSSSHGMLFPELLAHPGSGRSRCATYLPSYAFSLPADDRELPCVAEYAQARFPALVLSLHQVAPPFDVRASMGAVRSAPLPAGPARPFSSHS